MVFCLCKWITPFFPHSCFCELILHVWLFFHPHPLVSDNESKSLSRRSCTSSSPRQSSSSSSSQPARRRPLWPTADLNYCNQWMKSNQQPCMCCWQNAWPPALSTNQTAASHSQLITTCTQSSPLPSHLMEEALFSFPFVFCVPGLTGVGRIDEGWRFEMKLFPVLTRWQPWFPLLAPAVEARPDHERCFCTKAKFHHQI